MVRTRTVHRCTDCGAACPKWVGRCPTCDAWNTLVEEIEEVRAPAATARLAAGPAVAARPISEVEAGAWQPVSTGVAELDRVLGGGLVPGSVTLLGGEPGIGKSTLVLEAAGAMARSGRRVLYVSAEESAAQVRARAERLGVLEAELWLAASTELPDVVGLRREVRPEILVVDSVQALSDPELASAAGSVVQVRECAQRLVAEAKESDVAVVLIGHVTKDGTLAGPRVLEHVVDTVLAFEGDRHHALRLLRAVKHRYGSTNELGLFEMTDRGLAGVSDPSRLFLADRRLGVPGSVVVPIVEGHRPLLVELQALVAASPPGGSPRRSAQGFDVRRLSMLLAVLDNRAGISLADVEVYVSAVGGVDVGEPGADLGLALAVASARSGVALPGDLVACAEIGLGGELRQVPHLTRRLTEAARLGFRRAIVAASADVDVLGMVVQPAATLIDALQLAGAPLPPPGPAKLSPAVRSASHAGS